MSIYEGLQYRWEAIRATRAATLLTIAAVLMGLASLSLTAYYVGRLNSTTAVTQEIRRDLSAEQKARLRDTEQAVIALRERDRILSVQVRQNRQLILFLRELIRERPELFEGVTIPPTLRDARPIPPRDARPTNVRPRAAAPRPQPDTPGPTPRTPAPAPTAPAPVTPPPTTPPPTTRPPTAPPLPPQAQPPFVPGPPANPGPPILDPVVKPIEGAVGAVVCLAPVTCRLML